MEELSHWLCAAFRKAIQSIPKTERDDIYALALYLNDYEGMMYFSYNTRSHLAAQCLRAADAEDAVWAYAYWLQRPFWGWRVLDEFGILPEGLAGTTVINTWLEEQSILEAAGSGTEHRRTLHRDIALRLHASGVIPQTFGRVLPIILFDDDEGDVMDEATRAVNPAESLTAYVEHVERRLAEWTAWQQADRRS